MSQINKLRNEYIACIKLAEETDSKSQDALLREEAKNLLIELRQSCPHAETVTTIDEYEGNDYMEYSDAHREERICLCCGITDYAYGNEFKHLKCEPICRMPQDGKKPYPEQLKNPFNFLLSDLKEFAIEKGYRIIKLKKFY